MPSSPTQPVLDWYTSHARDLPWRADDATPWSVLVSEFMLQQTPVSRVLPAYAAWLARWPEPAALAADPVGEAIREWGRLGYPRRAVRLHAAAGVITERFGGAVPSAIDSLRTLPGVGGYTAAAVASFAFGQRHAVLDTNVRRVLARLMCGVAGPGRSTVTPVPAVSPKAASVDAASAKAAGSAPSVAEVQLAESLLPLEPQVAARWSVAVMELGALVCTATAPRCADCPVAARCQWLTAGKPAPPPEAKRRAQRYEGTDRQCRGAVLAVLRATDRAVPKSRIDLVWPDPAQLERVLDGLARDGLVATLPGGRYALPR